MNVRQFFLLLIIVCCCNFSFAQVIDVPLDRSPLDVCYYPMRYPSLKPEQKLAEPLLAKLYYSRPQKNGRKIFGELVHYNEVWRLGANEATEVEFFKDVDINGQKLPCGKYTMYAIPDSTQWQIIFNKDLDVWGAFSYNPAKDVLRTTVSTQPLQSPVETFTIYFDKMDKRSFALNILWDNFKLQIPLAPL